MRISSELNKQAKIKCAKTLKCLLRRGAFGFIAAMLILIYGVSASFAQSLSVGAESGLPGTNIDLQINFTPASATVSSLQFDLTFPPSLIYVATAEGSAATAAGKSAIGNVITGGVRVMIFGLNQKKILW